ncbi:MAG TPA: AAA family ATPase [Candidatus Avoscillospira stercorigallinarum]|uniref:AAA family ATPase n=1 Tax=Candidatus Avoscillospira stercorigallinarum TaxID=2840708 RepID=A0A9D0Z5I6_9FIRM|nr:AAA family ATPase [Candidatus Avoscillospira stercorigallinarum]
MELIRLQATFGCLDEAVLEPGPGLTVLTLPNGAGKSTWLAFLTAMFYGIDRAERKVRDREPVRTRYLPWSGKPMAGTVQLRWQGREIVLQRTSEGGKPLDTFRAYDPATGRTIPELTGETCGLQLLGVEKSVFLRTACIAGEALAVTPEAQLERRLSNLAATGRESDSARMAAETLAAWKRRCRHNKTGLLPQTEAQLRETGAALAQARSLRRERLACQAALAERAADGPPDSDLEAAQAADRAAQAALAGDPPSETLLQLRGALSHGGAEPVSLPPALESVSPGEILPAAQRALEQLSLPLPRWGLQGALTGLLLLLGLGLLLWVNPWLGAGVLALGLGALAWTASVFRRRRQHLARRRRILEAWQVEREEELMARAVACRDGLTAAWNRQVLLEEVRAFAPDVETADQARAAVDAALRRRETASQTADRVRTLERARWETGGETAALRERAAALAAREEALGGCDALEARVQQLEDRRQTLLDRERALTLALEALEAAQRTLETAYGPRLTAPAGAILRTLTRGQLDGLVLEEGRVLLVREAATGLTRPLSSMSRGTQDQVWLALRLALSALLLPPETPLLLDDALLTFDADRTAAALTQLRQAGRQVLLFTCRKLEEPQ